ncbi:uncharacterized protein BYT42DRAFT_554645 [Radiomyces spectabilis]|uniref:uncharacterized protein n=1 Tax=Radiomyces spectabilis TaxID=64574 RepID=UPI0022209244|nr:uncharacterized protein BYT42DRAFT_554645 [Radiomyces spectabilis]KAI8390874.1 hypothetical protein BYT42DRAFT_554645 [Radiomyces spectabilis]
MTDKLPPNLLKLFAPRPPLPYAPPLDKNPEKRVGAVVTGVASLVPMLKNYDPDYVPWKTIEEKRRERIAAKRKKAEEDLAKAISEYNPEQNEKAEGNPFNTLFVAHLSYDLTDKELKEEFELYGPIKNLRLVRTPEGKSRGYAFIEYEREKDMRAAYKDADGLKIFGRRVLVDVERGRTVKGWRPRRLGGGLGGTRDGRSNDSGRQRSRERHSSYSDRDRGYGGRSSSRGYGGYGGGGGYGYDRRDRDDRKRSRISRSRSPRSYNRDRERDRYGGRGRDRSRDRGGRRDRY